MSSTLEHGDSSESTDGHPSNTDDGEQAKKPHSSLKFPYMLIPDSSSSLSLLITTRVSSAAFACALSSSSLTLGVKTSTSTAHMGFPEPFADSTLVLLGLEVSLFTTASAEDFCVVASAFLATFVDPEVAQEFASPEKLV